MQTNLHVCVCVFVKVNEFYMGSTVTELSSQSLQIKYF